MKHLDFEHPCKVHFIGIGGISMSAYAELLVDRGFTVTGSDWKRSDLTTHLESLGVNVHYGPNNGVFVDPDTDLCIYTAACAADNAEILRARELSIPTISRGELVGEIMLHFKRNFAFSGSHGKTSSTAMLSSIAIEAGLDPTVQVGGVSSTIGSNIRVGHGEDMIVEACEYKDSFLSFRPTHAMITNIEPEHLDYFGTIDRERESYAKYSALLPANGLLVLNTGIPDYRDLFRDAACPIVTYGLESGPDTDYYASDISYNEYDCGSFTLMHHGEPVGRISLSVPGEHNITNAVGVSALSLSSGIPFESVVSGLANYKGTARRFEKKGEIAGVTIIDDYAHHPTEMTATMKVAQKYPHKRLVVVFQPHTYSRTAAFLHEIAEALVPADLVVFTDIYAARETDTLGISSDDIVRVLRDDFGKVSYHFSSFEETEDFLLEKCCTGDLLITMGAGDVVNIGDHLLGR